VLERVSEPCHPKHGMLYRCRCSCGTERTIFADLLHRQTLLRCRQCQHLKSIKVRIGRWYGSWWVIRRDGNEKNGNGAMFLCRCRICGREKRVASRHLISGHSTSCSCGSRGRTDPIIHATFGRWYVLEYAGVDKHRRSVYRCQCLCELHTIKVVCASRLVDGTSQSCGCLNREGSRDRIRARNISRTDPLFQRTGSGTYRTSSAEGMAWRQRRHGVKGTFIPSA